MTPHPFCSREWSLGRPFPRTKRAGFGSAARDVLDPLLAGRDPRHHRPQAGADLLDRVLLAGLLQPLEVGPARLGLGDPLVGELAGLDLVEDRLHLGPDRLADDAGAAGEVAVLGGVADRVAHAGDALLVHEIDDELELVQALE